MTVSNIVSTCLAHFNDYCGLHKTLSTILCKWQQNSVVRFFLYLGSVAKDTDTLVHNQAPIGNRHSPFLLDFHK